MVKNILSVIAGTVVAMVTFLVTEQVNSSLHPIPASLNFGDAEAVKSFYENQAISFWLLVLGGWIIGSLLCGFVIKLICKSEKKTLPIIAGIILTLSAIANFFALPHPTWFIVVGLLPFIPSSLFGHSLYKIKTNGN